MARKKSKSKSKPRKRKSSSRLAEVDWVRFRRVFLTAVALLTVAGVSVGSVYAVPRLSKEASRQQWADQQDVVFRDTPAWAEGPLIEWLTRVVQSVSSGDPLRRDDLVGVRERLLETGCFESVRQVRRTASDEIEIAARFIVPFMIVRDQAGDHLVDHRGRLLPSAYRAPESHDFLTVSGPTFGRPARAGTEWPGSDVTAAIALVELISQRPWHAQVIEINVSRFLTDNAIELITNRNGRIIWGAAPGAEGAREVLSAQKLAYLDRHYQDYRHIDRGCELLNITGDVVTCVE